MDLLIFRPICSQNGANIAEIVSFLAVNGVNTDMFKLSINCRHELKVEKTREKQRKMEYLRGNIVFRENGTMFQKFFGS